MTGAEREIERQVNRLASEAKRQVDLAVIHCAQHGPQYTCADAQPTEGVEYVWRGSARARVGTGRYSTRCRHIACTQIANKHCPECETP